MMWHTAPTLAVASGISRRAAAKALAQAFDGKQWRGVTLIVRAIAGRGGKSGVRYEVLASSLPEDIQKALSALSAPAQLPALLPSIPALPSNATYASRMANPDEAQRALAIYEKIKAATDPDLTPRERGAAVKKIVATTGMPRETVYEHVKRYREFGLEGLMRKRPSNAGKARCAVSTEFDRAFLAAGHSPELLPELGKYVDQVLIGLWKGRAADAGETDVGHLAQFLLFERCEEINAPMPREACLIGRKRVRQFRKYEIVNIRDNDAARFRNMLPSIARDWTGFAPMDIVIADVKHLDVLVTRPDGSTAYPKLIGFMDGGTGRIFAYLVQCPHRRSITQGLVIEAFIAMAQDEHWGFPRQLYLDNGSEFGGLDKIIPAISLLNSDSGREIIRAQPYNAQAKPIEPLFARLDRYCFSALPGYTGPDRTNKKTQNVGREPVAWADTWESFVATVGGLIDYYHQRPIGGQWGGRSANQVFQDKVNAGWRPTFPQPLALELAFCERKTIKLSKSGIRHAGKRWWHPNLAQLAFREELELLLPWKVDAAPVALLPDGQAFLLNEDFLYIANDVSGATEAGRRRQSYKRAVAKADNVASTIDPTEVKMRMAKRADVPAIPGRPRFLDQGATIHQLRPAGRLLESNLPAADDAAARQREAEKRRTERLERAMKHGY